MSANGLPEQPPTMQNVQPVEDARIAWRADNNAVLLKKSQEESTQKQKLLGKTDIVSYLVRGKSSRLGQRFMIRSFIEFGKISIVLDEASKVREKLYEDMAKGAEQRKAINREAHQKLIEEQRPKTVSGGNTWDVVNKMVSSSTVSKPELNMLKSTITMLGSK
eukprot:TRINITY_DN8174_c0_g1_i4.p2 TRINITY_DN8174_c0_g1~~TRINITY_DN8174_c0_g1_i4.p2  ORF type:complete len:163 (-),score=22.05 TRINITY_DN8174_c0_g1_i4:226-714(-)